MSLSTIILGVLFLGAVIGAKKPWAGCIAGGIAFPLLFYLFCPWTFASLVLTTAAGSILGYITGFVGSIFFSGFKGKGHNTGPSFMGGFGGGRGGAPPGGIVLSDEELRKFRR